MKRNQDGDDKRTSDGSCVFDMGRKDVNYDDDDDVDDGDGMKLMRRKQAMIWCETAGLFF